MKLERYIETNFSDVCVWDEVFNDDQRIVLQHGLMLTGLLAVIFGGWLSVTLLFTSLRFDNSYRNLANFTSVACIRRIMPTLLLLPLVKCIETLYGFQILSCNMFAFLETFLAVFEVEALTHVCIERYVIAKYITNGWPINKKHYYLYICLCAMFSTLYSTPPLFGIGRFSFDFQCTSCTFDVILPDNWKRYFVVMIFGLRSIKSTAMMVYMLVWARILERKYPKSMKHHQRFTQEFCVIKKMMHTTRAGYVCWFRFCGLKFLQNVILITLVNLLSWTPIAIIRGTVLLSQLIYAELPPISGFYTMWAMWIHWVAPVFTAIALFLVDDRVRDKMLNPCGPEKQLENNDIKTD